MSKKYIYKRSNENFFLVPEKSSFSFLTNPIRAYRCKVEEILKKEQIYANLPNDFYTLMNSGGINDYIVPTSLYTDKLISFQDTVFSNILEEIENYWKLGDKFRLFGYQPKRGYLLYGPPGNGKTSIINLIVQKALNHNILTIQVRGINIESIIWNLRKIREIEKDRHILFILEDIDTFIKQNGEGKVLSLLDGQDSIDNITFLATTNYPEDLDGRLTNRPSRFDRVIYVGYPTMEQRYQFLCQKYTGLSEKELQKWAEKTDKMSFAHLKELIVSVLVLGGDFNIELERIKKMSSVKTSNKEKDNTVGFGFMD